MAMLHIVNKSPFEKMSFGSCLNHAKPGDSILMIEDAAVGSIKNSSFSEQLTSALADKKVYVLGGDLAARGIDQSRMIDGIEVVDYAGFVDLSVNNETTQSWL
ncbi:MAG: tRNA 2-thiouridine synthesizing protein B [Cocleimonas sp.]|jgi:tRNA 2-thiouridine synthesizing protein B